MTQQAQLDNNSNQFGQADQRPDPQQGGQGGPSGQGSEPRTFEQEEQRRRQAQGESIERDNDETQGANDGDRQGDAEAGAR